MHDVNLREQASVKRQKDVMWRASCVLLLIAHFTDEGTVVSKGLKFLQHWQHQMQTSACSKLNRLLLDSAHFNTFPVLVSLKWQPSPPPKRRGVLTFQTKLLSLKALLFES